MKYDLGSKKYVTDKMSSKEIAVIVKQYNDIPHTRFSKSRQKMINVTADMAKLVGLAHLTNDKSGKALMVKSLQDGHLDKTEYVAIYKSIIMKKKALQKQILQSDRVLKKLDNPAIERGAQFREFYNHLIK